MIAIKVNRCRMGHRWYRKFIGEHVPYLGDTGTEWKSRERDGYVNFVQYDDGELIELTATTGLDKFLRIWYNVSVEVYMNLLEEIQNDNQQKK
jgi:hypothetical protein